MLTGFLPSSSKELSKEGPVAPTGSKELGTCILNVFSLKARN